MKQHKILKRTLDLKCWNLGLNCSSMTLVMLVNSPDFSVWKLWTISPAHIQWWMALNELLIYVKILGKKLISIKYGKLFCAVRRHKRKLLRLRVRESFHLVNSKRESRPYGRSGIGVSLEESYKEAQTKRTKVRTFMARVKIQMWEEEKNDKQNGLIERQVTGKKAGKIKL